MLARRIIHKESTNSPFLSGDSFAGLADYVPFGLEGQGDFEPEKALASEIFFVQADRLEDFEELGDQIGLQPLVVMTGNSDRNFQAARQNPLNCSLWLAQNNAMPLREGLGILPIGLENKRLGRLGLEHHYRRKISSDAKNSILVPPMRSTNPIRALVSREALALGDPFTVLRRYRQAPFYFRIARRFRFILCLEGNGFENHRIWESLYIGSFPVLLRTSWSSNLETLGLPLLIVDSLHDINQELLDNFVELHSKYDPVSERALWIPFWTEKITSMAKGGSS